MKRFDIDITQIKIASNPESKVMKTIEELLELNKLIPSRTKKEVIFTTEKQMDNSDYKNKKSRGEQSQVTERQFGDRKDDSIEIIELQLESKHDKEKEDNSKVRGHKSKNVAPIWLQVYKQEDVKKK